MRPEENMAQAIVHAYQLALYAAPFSYDDGGLVTNPKGTRSETAVVNWAKFHEFWKADRLTKTGTRDRGDVKLADGVMVQVKDGYTEGREPSDYLIGQWLAKLDEQKKHGGWDYAFLCHKRAGKANPDLWRWYMDGYTFHSLIHPLWAGLSVTGSPLMPPYIQLQGYMIPPLLHNAGITA